MKKFLLLLFMALCLVFSGCKKEPNEKKPHKNKLVWGENTVLITDDDNRYLKECSEYLLVFEKNDKIDKVKVGDILLSNITTLAPMGYLSKVTEVIKENETITLKTEDATLEQAIQECNLIIEYKIKDDDILEVIENGRKGDEEFSFFKDFKINFGDSHCSLSATIHKLVPTLHAKLEIDWFTLKEFEFYIQVEGEMNFEFTGKIEGEKPIFNEKKIRLKPIMFPEPIGIPLVNNTIFFAPKLKGEFKAVAKTAETSKFTNAVGIRYKDGAWSSINESENNLTSQEPKLSCEGFVALGLFGGYKADAIRSASLKLEVGAGAKLKAEQKHDPKTDQCKIDWAIVGFIEGNVEAEVKFIRKTIGKYEVTLFPKEIPTKLKGEISIDCGNFVPVTDITNLPTTATAGTPLTLTGKVVPAEASMQKIDWSMVNAGNTGATINGDKFTATKAGTAKVRATIAGGIDMDVINPKDFVKDFNIEVKEEKKEPLKITLTWGNGSYYLGMSIVSMEGGLLDQHNDPTNDKGGVWKSILRTCEGYQYPTNPVTASWENSICGEYGVSVINYSATHIGIDKCGNSWEAATGYTVTIEVNNQTKKLQGSFCTDPFSTCNSFGTDYWKFKLDCETGEIIITGEPDK